jgi:prolyl oligopeptidase
MTEITDPYLWLEDVEGDDALAWVRARDEATTGVLCDEAFAADKAAIYEISTRPTNIPFITRRGAYVYNYWQDRTHVRGLWRRTTLDDYRSPEPTWDVLLDLDALARDEGEDWVWRGCSTFEPDHRIGLMSLSRGGADATVTREFDLEAKAFVPGGFSLPEAKGGATWVDRDTLLVSVTLGEDATTASGYPRKVRRWRRGEPFEATPVLFEGERGDVWISGAVDREPGFERTFMRRQITFEEGESFLVAEDGTLRRLDLPLDARFSVDRDWIFVRLKSDWALPGRTYRSDSLLVGSFPAFLEGERDFTILFEPAPRRVLESFFWADTKLFITVLDNLASEIQLARPDASGGWDITPVPGLPDAANVDVWPLDAGSIERTDEALVSVTSFLQPSSLGMIHADGRFEILKEAPAAFDATGLTVARHEAVAEDGERIPYFEIGRAERDGPSPTVLYGYGGFSVSMTPSYLGSVGRVWLESGGVWVVAVIRGGGGVRLRLAQGRHARGQARLPRRFRDHRRRSRGSRGHDARAARGLWRIERRAPRGQHADPLPRALRRHLVHRAAPRHAALYGPARGRELDGGVRRSRQGGGLGLHAGLLGLPERRGGQAISSRPPRHVAARRSRSSRSRAQDGGAAHGGGRRRAVLRARRRRARRGEQGAGRLPVGTGIFVPAAHHRPVGGGIHRYAPGFPRRRCRSVADER